jgi:hypothetical protein
MGRLLKGITFWMLWQFMLENPQISLSYSSSAWKDGPKLPHSDVRD